MADDDVKLATVDDAPNPLTALVKPPAEPEMVVQGLRYLRDRIPNLIQLSLKERRSIIRAANLDPEFIEIGIQAAGAWQDTKQLIGRTEEDLRQEAAEIQRWDAAERELRALANSIADANLKRKHRLGKAILDLYYYVRATLDVPRNAHMRTFFEDMKRILLRTQGKGRRGRKSKEEPTGGD